MARPALTRDFYIPKEARALDCPGTDAAIYLYTTPKGKVAALGFHGKAQKPDFHFIFRSDVACAERIKTYLDGRRRCAEHKEERKAKRNAPHSLKVGDILVSSWGYDQTNVDFYEVTRLVGTRNVEIRKIAQDNGDGVCGDRGTCRPVPGDYISAPMTKRPSAENYVKIASYASAWPWEGRPHYWSSYA